jgi:hypothetical protein
VDSKTAHVGIEPGDGLVGRFGDTVILIPGPAADGDVAAELLRLIADVASDLSVPGSTIAARLAGWVIGRMPGEVIAFGVVAPVPEGVVIFLRGAVQAEVTGPDPARLLSGEQALTWVDQLIPASFGRLAIGGTAGRPVRPHPRSDLQAGVVAGQGFVVTPLAAHAAVPDGSPSRAATPAEPPVAPPPPETPAVPPPAEQPVLAAAPAGPPASAAPTEPPVPAMAPDQAAAPVPPPPPVTLTPRAAPARPAPAGPGGPVKRPPAAGPTVVASIPVGVLTSDSGPTIPLDRSYALGREPNNDPLVRSGAASPIVLQDPDHVISRVHAYISVAGDKVTVRDASSTQGTYIARPGAGKWTRVTSEPSVLLPGWSMRIGKLVFTFQASGTAGG